MRQRCDRGMRRLRRWARAADFWVQDHHVFVVIVMFILLLAAAGVLLWMDWATVIGLAKDLAPVATIVSIIATAFLGIIKWFRKRRTARLARAATVSVPRARVAETDRPAGARGAPSESAGGADTGGDC
ncbi:hypothetical protein [Streptomyces chartreusis]|uniref:hypothetical protein n=1 Tax=Streptomyces chartreusis TaxID=1969 RepID=UPI0016783A6B|nr:hypothetical protein [Streptomyces chartreusis]